MSPNLPPPAAQPRQVQTARFVGLSAAQIADLGELVSAENVTVGNDVSVTNISEDDLLTACAMLSIKPQLTRFYDPRG